MKYVSILLLFINLHSVSAFETFNINNFGAQGHSGYDSTNAFLSAWRQACNTQGTVNFYVPPGRFFVRNIEFRGPCRSSRVIFNVKGHIIAPDYRYMSGSNFWILFYGIDGLTIHNAKFNGGGPSLWACKKSNSHCPIGATTLTICNSKNVEINGIRSFNSELFHIAIVDSQQVKINRATIDALPSSPNTDGIHVETSSYVDVLDSQIHTGDDCISIGPGSAHVWIQGIRCGPGHGISIGSLGRSMDEKGVANVTVNNVTFTNTQNGARIKTWGKSSTSFVNRIIFENLIMENAQNPIIIDQNYCPHNQGCTGQDSGVKINDVTYQGIYGSSATELAVTFDCSRRNPCSDIKFKNINLKYQNRSPKSLCRYINGESSGYLQPSSCF